METIEDVVLRYSRRGMDVLRAYMDDRYCKRAVERILSLRRGTVLLTTGFYVAGHAETDGPLGTMVLAKALARLGYNPVIITDKYCDGLFEIEQLKVEYVDINAPDKAYEQLLNKHNPVCLISIERCGRNAEDDYTNMRGVSIKAKTARMDLLFEKARKQNIPTFGVGDGGNEIGMGNLKEVIEDKLQLVPCAVKVDELVIATVSNWGAYALAAYMQQIMKVKLLPDFKEIKSYLEAIVRMGSVDGVTREQMLSVDGFSLDVEREIIEELQKVSSYEEEEQERKAG